MRYNSIKLLFKLCLMIFITTSGYNLAIAGEPDGDSIPLGQAQKVGWTNGSGKSCQTACTDVGLSGAYYTGKITNGNDVFHICRVNSGGQGYRGGWNLKSFKGGGTCEVPFGGESSSVIYDCMCYKNINE